jgi:hypothetical protein
VCIAKQLVLVGLTSQTIRSRFETIMVGAWSECEQHTPAPICAENSKSRARALALIAGASAGPQAEALSRICDVTLRYGCGGGPSAQQHRLVELASVVRESIPAEASPKMQTNLHSLSWCAAGHASSTSACLYAWTATMSAWLGREELTSATPSASPLELAVLAVQEVNDLDSGRTAAAWRTGTAAMLKSKGWTLLGISLHGSCGLFLAGRGTPTDGNGGDGEGVAGRVSDVEASGVSLARALAPVRASAQASAAALRFRIDRGTPVVAVSIMLGGGQAAHFAARREQELRSLLAKLQFARGRSATDRHQHIILQGNFNSRLCPPLRHAKAAVELLAREKKWAFLAEMDQLRQWLRPGGPLAGYGEGSLAIPFTYRSEKTDQPNWCDRIIFRAASGLQAVLVHYDTVQPSNAGLELSGDTGDGLGRKRHVGVAARLQLEVRGRTPDAMRNKAREEYEAATGPLDPTVSLHPTAGLDLHLLREALETFGDVDMLRILGATAYATFTDAPAAAACAEASQIEVGGHQLCVRLRPLGRPSRPLTADDLRLAPLPPARRRRGRTGDMSTRTAATSLSATASDATSDGNEQGGSMRRLRANTRYSMPDVLQTDLWLVGSVAREDAESWLRKVGVKGAFLIRHSAPPGEQSSSTMYSISFIANEGIRHYRVKVCTAYMCQGMQGR